MSNLFAQADAANSFTSGNKPLVSFKAGRMKLEGGMVKPEKEKGMVELMRTPHDALLHFIWRDRATGKQEEDWNIFPGSDSSFTRVEKCTSGRVYRLEIMGRNLFYWMQEPKTDKDEEHCQNINKLLKGGQIDDPAPSPAAAGAGAGASSPAAPAAAAGASPAQGQGDLLQSLLQAQGGGQGGDEALARALAMALGGGAAPQASGGAAPAGGMFGMPQQQRLRPDDSLDLHNLLNGEATGPSISSDVGAYAHLAEHLPPNDGSQTTEEHLLSHLRSPQFRQTVGLFNSAVSDPEAYHEITTSFEVPAEGAAPNEFGAAPFVNRVQAANPPEGQGSAGGEEAMEMDNGTDEAPAPAAEGGEKPKE